MQSTELLKHRGSADPGEQLLHDLGASLEDLGVFEEGVDEWNNVVLGSARVQKKQVCQN